MFVSLHSTVVESPPTTSASPHAASKKTHLAKPHCAGCHLGEWCMPGDPAKTPGDCRDSLIFGRRKVRTGDSLYREGEAFRFLYQVRSGTLKSCLNTGQGQERVSAFHMAGELIGLDGIANGHHASSAIALEDTEVCAASYDLLNELAQSNARLQRTLLEALSRESVRELHMLVRIVSMSSERRLAAFLLNLSQRLSARGYSPSEFRMRMSRADIGSYLGLTVETLSRNFSAFQKMGVLEVDQRHVRIANLESLKQISGLEPGVARRVALTA